MNFPILEPILQVSFSYRLQEIEQLSLRKALECAVKGVDLSAMNAELDEYVSTDSLRHVAALGLRGEVVFPVPVILRKAPFLLGYYRLLLGFSQKEFYSKGPFGRFGRMEKEGRLTSAIDPLLADLCRSLCESMGLLLKGLGRLSHETVRDLQLLTLGPQLRGGANTKVGQKATTEVFGLIAAIVGDHALEQSSRSIIVKNARGQNVLIEFASDPDIAATEKLPSGVRPLVSIEIKGGGGPERGGRRRGAVRGCGHGQDAVAEGVRGAGDSNPCQAPIAAEGRVIMMARAGLLLFSEGDKGMKPLGAPLSPPRESTITPYVSEGRLFFRGPNYLWA